MRCTANERAALPVLLYSDPQKRESRYICRWFTCCLAGAVLTIIADPERWCTREDAIGPRAVFWVPSNITATLRRGCTAGVPVVCVLSCRCLRHHHFEREMQSGTRERFGRTRAARRCARLRRCTGRAASDLVMPRGRVCCDLRLRQHELVSDDPRKESTTAVRNLSMFCEDLHSYVAHQQQPFKETRDLRGALLPRHWKTRRVRERR